MCDAADASQQWVFAGTDGAPGAIKQHAGAVADHGVEMCVSGACDALNVTGRTQANGCVPLPLVPVSPQATCHCL